MRLDRRCEPLADPDQDRVAARDPRPDLGVHLLLHAVLERIHLRAHLPAINAEQDGAGCNRQRVRRWRHLPLGIADGVRAGGLAAAGHPLRLLRRALCVGNDRSREGVSPPWPAPDKNPANNQQQGVGSCTFWFWAPPAWSAANCPSGCCVTGASANATLPG